MSGPKLLKTIAITAAAQEHHVAFKTKSVLKWLKSGHEVRVQIQGKADRQKTMEDIFKRIERDVKGGAAVKQKVLKPDSIKFNLKPTPEAANLVIPDSAGGEVDGDNLDEIMSDKDILSDDFQKELMQSIEEDKSRRRKK